MQGYKTWTGIIITILGFLGLGYLINGYQLGKATNDILEVIGIIMAIYGNYKAHREIKSLGGYRPR